MGSIIVVSIALIGFRGQASAQNATAPGSPTLFFGICSDNVLQIDIVNEGRQGLPVMTLTLTPKAQKQLYELTQKHLGRELDVVFDGVSLARAKIHASVDSGLIISREWRSMVAARAFAKLIRDEAIDAPCGVLGELKSDELGFERRAP